MNEVNEAAWDRAARVVLGVAVLAYFLIDQKSYAALWGLIPIATGVLGVCPIYGVLGIKTCGSTGAKTPG